MASYQKSGEWSTGLCDCFSDLKTCCLTLWCPCITFGRIAEILDRGSISCGSGGALWCLLAQYGLACAACPSSLYSCGNRSKLRAQYALPESPCGDCLVHCFCGPCALCQEYRELQNHGFDMSVGWHANADKKNTAVTMAPNPHAGMSK